MHLLDGIQSPEGEEDGNLLARSGRPIGEYKGSQSFVKVIAEKDESFAFFFGRHLRGLYRTRGSLLYQYNMFTTFRTLLHELVARRTTPCFRIARETRIGGSHFQTLSRLESLHRFLQLQDRAGTLDATSIYTNHLNGGGRRCRASTRIFLFIVIIRWKKDGLCSRFVSLQATNQIAHIRITMPLQDVRSQVATQAYATEKIHRSVGRNLVHPFAQVIQRNVHRSRNTTQRSFVRRTHIHQRHLRKVSLLQLPPIKRSHLATQDIARHITRNRHRVFGRRERRSVGMLQSGEVFNGRPVLDGQGILVDSLIDSIITHYLGTIQASVGRREGNLDVHLQSSRIVTGMRTRMDGSRQVRNLHLLQSLGRQSRRCHGHVEHLGDGGTDRTFVCLHIAEHHIVRHDTGLTIGWACQEVQPRLAGNRVGEFNGIAHGIDGLIRCLQILIHPDSSHFAQLQAGFLSQGCLCPHTDGEQHQVSFQLDARLEIHLQATVLTGKGFYGLLQIELYAFLLQMLMNEGSHREINRPHHLIGHFHHRHLGTGMMQVLRHLQPDESATHNHGTLHGIRLHIVLDSVRIGYITQSKDTFAINARQGRTYRRCTRRKKQLVIRFGIFTTVRSADMHQLLVSFNTGHFTIHPYIDVETLAESLRRLNEKAVTFFNHSAYIIR